MPTADQCKSGVIGAMLLGFGLVVPALMGLHWLMKWMGWMS